MENTKEYSYANRVEINSSVYDMIISFYQATPIKDDNGNIIAEEKGSKTNVVMSPQHAKSFMLIMKEQIDWYEENIGEIKLVSNEPTTSGD